MIKQKRLTIGIIIDTSLKIPPNTGVTYRLYFLSQKLSKLGINIKLFLCNRNIKRDRDASILFDKSNIEYHIIPEKTFYDDKKLLKIITNNRPDILQFEDCQTIIRCKKISNKLKIPTYLEIHDVEATLKYHLGFSGNEIKTANKITKNACALASKVSCMTSLDFNELIANKSIKKNKLLILPNPIDTKFFPFYGANLKSFNIIFIGNMFYWPNAEAAKAIINKIYPSLKKIEGLKIYFIGMVPKYLKNISKNKQLIFTGPVNNLNKYLKKSSIALCPVSEGSGMKVKILNYCSAGLPIITTSIGASGYEKIKSLIIENDIKKYPNIINKLYLDKTILYKIGKNNRKFIKKFNIDKVAKETINLYKKLSKNNFSCNKSIKITKDTKQLLWLKENRLSMVKNTNYYIIKHGKIIFKEKVA
jgi:glycosyltransferase involved in cell wall biosynthesis